MRTLTAPQTLLLEGAHRAVHTRVWVADLAGLLVDYSDYLLPGTVIEEGVDEAVNALTLHFDRSIGEASLSPLMTDEPPIALGREVVFEAAVTANTADPVAGDWFEMFRGQIRAVDPTSNDMVVVAQDQAGALHDRWIKVKDEEYGAEDGSETLEAVITELLDRWDMGVLLHTPVPSEAGVTPYLQQVQTLLEASRALAESIGWTARYWWDDVEGEYRFTLLGPPRGKTEPDWTMSPSRYLEVRELKQDVEDIRNYIIVRYVDEEGAQQSMTFTDPASIAKYGERYLELVEGTDSPIKTAEQATYLGEAALSDLSEPDATHGVEDFLLPHLQLWDLIEFEANDVHYSANQNLAVMSLTHSFPAPGVGRTTAMCRGKPSGGVLMWRRRAQGGKLTDRTTNEPETVYGFTDFNRRYTQTLAISTFRVGAKIAEVWIFEGEYAVEDAPDEPYVEIAADLSSATVLVVGVDALEYTTTIPAFGFVKYVQFEARQADLGFGPGSLNIICFEIQPNQVGTEALVDEAVIAAKLAAAAVTREKILDGAVNDLKMADFAVTNAKLALLAVNTANIVDAALTEVKIANAAVTGAKIAALAVAEANLASGAVTTAKLGLLAVTSAILAASAVTETKISDGAISTPKLQAGAITAGTIASGAVTTIKLDALAVTAEKVAASAIIAEKIAAGAVIADKIGAGAVVTAKLDAGAVTADKVAAGAIVAGKISAGAIDATNLIANGIITNALIATGTITGDRLVANTVTADQIAANAITADELSANAVTADKILAGAITTLKIAAGAVTANEINVSALSAISADLGQVTAGYIRNPSGSNGTAGISLQVAPHADWTRYLDLSGSGSYFLYSAQVQIDHSGNATFSGALSAASGTFTGTVSAGAVVATGDFTSSNAVFSGVLSAGGLATVGSPPVQRSRFTVSNINPTSGFAAVMVVYRTTGGTLLQSSVGVDSDGYLFVPTS